VQGFIYTPQEDGVTAATWTNMSINKIRGYDKFIRELGITTHRPNKDDEVKPAQDLLTKRTLAYTPYLCFDLIGRLLHGTQPQLYIGTSLDELIRSDADDMTKEIKDNVESFKEDYVWKRMPLMGNHNCCVTLHQEGVSNMCIYRRIGNGVTADTTWKRGEAGPESGDRDTEWELEKCDRSEHSI
jgi:hypothetical protein